MIDERQLIEDLLPILTENKDMELSGKILRVIHSQRKFDMYEDVHTYTHMDMEV